MDDDVEDADVVASWSDALDAIRDRMVDADCGRRGCVVANIVDANDDVDVVVDNVCFIPALLGRELINRSCALHGR